MALPSQMLIEEIQYYEGMNSTIYCNALGVPVIGYGYAIMQEPKHLCKKGSVMHKRLKHCTQNEMQNGTALLEKMLSLPFEITQEKANEILVQELLHSFDVLSEKFAGFRHIVNLCGEAYTIPQSASYLYTDFVQKENNQQAKPTANVITKQRNTHLLTKNKRRQPCYAEVIGEEGNASQEELAHGITPFPNIGAMPYLYRKSASYLPIHNAYFTSAKTASSAVASSCKQRRQFQQQQKHYAKKAELVPKTFYLHEKEKAVLRVDSILFLAHLLGLEQVCTMQNLFLALLEEDYAKAQTHILAHKSSAYLGAIVHILARRIRYGVIDIFDCRMAKQKPQLPKRKVQKMGMRLVQEHFSSLNPDLLTYKQIQKRGQKGKKCEKPC